ncbi:PHP domain-containing protein [Moraxella lacunata]|uniref:Phosphatase n=1 Tax=Moraxella lacunata TaxID=477 RepID=A0A1V4GMB1_MORLA|nr:PHP domain-containing protein [Moraxella lacunata]OPH33560.1 phosphatase [Moraxella lacunata]
MIKVDLHSHSTCSDGTLTPAHVVKLAHEMGIEIFALTDHDTTAGIDEAWQMADELGMRLIDGVEISCHHQMNSGYGKNKSTTKTIHVVALDFKDKERLNHKLNHLQNSRETRGHAIVVKMVGILTDMADFAHIDEQALWQAVLDKANGNAKAVGRAHIACVLFEMDVVKTVQEAFDKYLADNKPAYVAIDSLSMAQTIALIHECGGISVLAHPTRYHLSATRVRKLIADFAMLGGHAVELPSPSEPTATRAMIDRCVAGHGLMVSVGSDFHGANMPWRKLGQVATPRAEQVGVWERF